MGFAAGNNPAIRFALEKFADYIFILNPDAIIERDTLTHLVETAEQNDQAGIISPIILKGWADEIWFSGGKINWLNMRTEHINLPVTDLPKNPYPTEYVTGCAMLIKKNVFKEIGLFNEDYFLYYEDADFSYRAHKKDFELIIDPRIIIRHWEKSNNFAEQKIYWLVLSGLIFFQKNTPFFFRPWIFFYTILRKLKNYRDLKTKTVSGSTAVQKAYHDYILWKKDRRSQLSS
jgi:GT2 family glycosyltransferase